MTLSLRTIKTAIAAFISIMLAQWFGLEYAVAAGIIAILSVLDTNKSSMITAVQRVISTVLALGIAVILFYLLGFEVYVFAIYLLIYVPAAYRLGVESGIAPCSVLVTHLLIEKNISLPFLGNELMLMLIGAGIAILINLYMPSKTSLIDNLRNQADNVMKNVLLSLSNNLRDATPFDVSLLNQLDDLLEEAEKNVFLESENRLSSDLQYDINYIEMRKKQADILQYMQQNAQICQIPMKENKILAGLLYLTADQLHQNNTGVYLLEDIRLLFQHFRESDLPKTRAEFENRAILFQLLNDFTRFIKTKKDFFDKFGYTID